MTATAARPNPDGQSPSMGVLAARPSAGGAAPPPPEPPAPALFYRVTEGPYLLANGQTYGLQPETP